MQMLPNLSMEDKKKIAKLFSEALDAGASTWAYNQNNKDYINDYLENDLKRFPNQIREYMLSLGAKIEQSETESVQTPSWCIDLTPADEDMI